MGTIRVGTSFKGIVDEINGEYIVTKFSGVDIPIHPIASYYATGPIVSHSPESESVPGFEIPLNGKSIFLTYVRGFLYPITAFLIPWAYFVQQPWVYIALSVCLIIVIPSIFWWGKLSKKEILRRRIYQKYTGLYADPNNLPTELRSTIYESLVAQWNQLPKMKQSWTLHPKSGRLNQGNLRRYELAYTMSQYIGGNKDANALWALILKTHPFLDTINCGEK
jgi:hypothetical protein